DILENDDAMLERSILAGIQARSSGEVSNRLRGTINEQVEEILGTTVALILKPLNALEEASDMLLFGKIVTYAQLGTFEVLTNRIQEKNTDWSQAKADKVAAHYINTLLGTLPDTWMSRTVREAGSALVFARNWTFSNLDILTKAMTGGRKGLGTKVLSKEERQVIGSMFGKHLVKGTFGLIAANNIMQYMFLAITNDLKKRGLLDGAQSEIHSTFSNPKGHRFDIDTGMKTKTGQPMYLIGPLFRYMRDYFGFGIEPLKTLYNKAEPLLKSTIEQITNYSNWQKDEIASDGHTTWGQLKLRAKYFVEGLTPMRMFQERPGKSKTKFEWIVPFLGLWIRRGAPGGPIVDELFRWEEKMGIEQEPIRNQISVDLQEGNFQKAFETAAESGIVKALNGLELMLMRQAVPLTYRMKVMSDSNRALFLTHMETLGYTEDNIKNAVQAEINASALRGD
ncbi:hypothetical protein LCGC14_2603360, partial [marine sediment metagenome]